MKLRSPGDCDVWTSFAAAYAFSMRVADPNSPPNDAIDAKQAAVAAKRADALFAEYLSRAGRAPDEA